MAGGDKDAEMNLLMSGIDFTDAYESVATQQFRNEDNMGENDIGEGNIQQETENARNEGDTDSSNADYTQPQWKDEEDTDDEPESDQNSLVYEDIEASSNEDIFLEKNLSKRQMMMKLRRMLKQKSKQKNISHDAGAEDCPAKDNACILSCGITGTHTNEVPSSDFQDTHASRQRVADVDTQPDVFQQSNPTQLTNTQSSQSSRKTMKKSIRGGKGTYQGPRNDALLGNKVGKNQEATTGPREANGVVLRPREANPTVVDRSKKPIVAEVLRNIKHRFLEKRAKQF
ncbi:hypothetical protein Salat_2657000 [Sesamum alatum]|uniref:Uncharacterized protein n=1 Tax=Sesamum alatum TaxID=300844 RepID=A0AAE1XPA5_9LAMI|nr:hypothetical protein Salat_2657000 [Sesamum alatum]